MTNQNESSRRISVQNSTGTSQSSGQTYQIRSIESSSRHHFISAETHTNINNMIRRQSLHILCGIFSLVTAFATSNFGNNRFSSLLRENGSGGGDFSELTSALSRLDQQWQIQQSSKTTRSRWSKLMLPAETNNDTQGNNTNDVDQTTTTTTNNDDYVWQQEMMMSLIEHLSKQ